MVEAATRRGWIKDVSFGEKMYRSGHRKGSTAIPVSPLHSPRGERSGETGIAVAPFGQGAVSYFGDMKANEEVTNPAFL